MLQKKRFEFPQRRPRWLAGPALAVLVLAALAAGCEDGRTARQSRPADRGPRVVTTSTIVADLVRQVGGERVEVECLLGTGSDPHSYRATPRDADRLLNADLIVSSGLRFEGRLAELLGRLAGRVPVLAVADTLPADRLLEAAAGIPDPHVWLDAALWSLLPAGVAEALGAVDPEAADLYRARAESYSARLLDLDETIRRRIAAVPQDRRMLVTAHDAFRYFGRAYGLEVVGIQGTNTASEAGLGDVERLVDLVVRRGVPAVFVETSVADRNVAAVIEGARARGHALGLGGRLHSDSLGEAATGVDTLEGALLANVEAIVAALGTAPRESLP